MVALIKIAVQLLADAAWFVILRFRPTQSVQAENLFLRRQLALFKERGVQPRRIDAATRASLVILARLFERRAALFVVQPKTMIRWQRAVVAPVVAMEVSTVPTENAGRVTWTDLQDGAGEFDRDSIFSRHSDESIRALGLGVLKSPARCPKANAICERVIGTIRRECLDWLIPISEGHLRSILKSWVEHYNRGRPHSSLGPGVPDPPQALALNPKSQSRHRLAAGAFVLAKSVLGGLHHEYCLAMPASA